MSDRRDEAGEVELSGKNFNVEIRSFVISKFAASLGWYSSQNKYFFLFLHSFAAATQLNVGRYLPKLQQGVSELLNPACVKHG